MERAEGGREERGGRGGGETGEEGGGRGRERRGGEERRQEIETEERQKEGGGGERGRREDEREKEEGKSGRYERGDERKEENKKKEEKDKEKKEERGGGGRGETGTETFLWEEGPQDVHSNRKSRVPTVVSRPLTLKTPHTPESPTLYVPPRVPVSSGSAFTLFTEEISKPSSQLWVLEGIVGGWWTRSVHTTTTPLTLTLLSGNKGRSYTQRNRRFLLRHHRG